MAAGLHESSDYGKMVLAQTPIVLGARAYDPRIEHAAISRITSNCRGGKVLLTLEERLPRAIRKAFGRSLHIRHVDSGSCNGCEFETTALMNPVYDIQRFGIDFVASPRHADMLLVTGGVTRNLEEALRKTYEAVANPKILVAVGACACGDGMIGTTYGNFGGVDKIFPVSVYVPGCPPRPQAILEGILSAIERAHELKSASN